MQMHAQQQPYTSNEHEPPESYRAAANKSRSMSQAPPLPSIQHFEGGQTMQTPYGPPLLNGAQQPPHYPPPQYYQNGGLQAHGLAPNLANGQNSGRYAMIPAQAPINPGMAGARKTGKEIKRRTKTGCMTCRKRRIKCDEGHPTCRNCQKSKRECLGYDPIFKQQPAPAPIQPAPAGSLPGANTAPSTRPSNAYPQPSHPFPPTGAPYANPPGVQAPYDQPFEPGVSLDPSLGAEQTQHLTHQHLYTTIMLPQRRARPLAIEQLYSLNNIPPQYQPREAGPPISPATYSEIEVFFTYHYAPGLDKLFETTWFKSRGIAQLHSSPELQDFVAQCTEVFRSDDPERNRSRPSLEARLIWQLAAMPRVVAQTAGLDPVVQDVLPRIDVVEHLLTGRTLDPSRMPPPPQQDSSDAHKYGEQVFWYQLGRLVSLRDDSPDPAAQQQAKDCLDNMRAILGMMETRDVLYSLAVARHVGGRMQDFVPYQALAPVSAEQEESVKKLNVARVFVEDEDRRGGSQVIQRICGMSIRSWMLQRQQDGLGLPR